MMMMSMTGFSSFVSYLNVSMDVHYHRYGVLQRFVIYSRAFFPCHWILALISDLVFHPLVSTRRSIPSYLLPEVCGLDC